jgi:hypothetical protein
MFPAFEGDSFFVTIPPSQSGDLRAAEVLQRWVLPSLRAVGFQRSASEITSPGFDDRAEDAQERAAERAEDKAERAADKAEDRGEAKRKWRTDHAEDDAERAADQAEDAAERAAEKAEDAAEKKLKQNQFGAPLPTADLTRLARQSCLEFADIAKTTPGLATDCRVMAGYEAATPDIDADFQNGEGMTFAQYKAEIERRRIQYAFRQTVQNTPIEHSGVFASRWEGETVTLIHGSVFNRFGVTNQVKLTPAQAAGQVPKALSQVAGTGPTPAQTPSPIELVLLPYGSAVDGSGATVPGLRYAYRMLVFGTFFETVTEPGGGGTGGIGVIPSAPRGSSQTCSNGVCVTQISASWLLWMDAETGGVLELVPQTHLASSATARVWRRAADTPTIDIPDCSSFGVLGACFGDFQVNASSGGNYQLLLNETAPGTFNRIDRLGNGTFADGELSISDSSGGSSSSLANFDQSPLNDAANAVCSSGANNTFRQVQAMAQLSRLHEQLVSAGTFPAFPENAITVGIDLQNGPGFSNSAGYDQFGTGQSGLNFTDGGGFESASCPDLVGTTTSPGTIKMNGVSDITTMGHEFTHLSTARLGARRPSDWCACSPPCTCQMPTGHSLFHDFADAMAHHYGSINCMGGYSVHNAGSVNGSLNCVGNTDQGGGLPRDAKVTVPYDPTSTDDHFPEHRLIASGDYADGQMIAAALWQTRVGMRSKCMPSGTAQYFVRAQRALYNFGMLSTTCMGCDRDIYRYGSDFYQQMVQQWATSGQAGGPPAFHHNGAHTTNKVMAGFAKAGFFLMPYQCIDGDATTTDPGYCPSGEYGGDAIVDIDDNDPSNDITIDGVVHPTFDYLNRSNGPPTFNVWTGPRYLFSAAGDTTFPNPAPCNGQFQVEVANDPNFTMNLVSSGFQSVNLDPTMGGPQCFGTWSPSVADWTTLKAGTGTTRIYYRVTTRKDAADMVGRISTSPGGPPGSGLFTVPAPYAIVNDTGTQD